jgi:catechol 2,3-dioxygenase-like lactoylglutathione lyase family enzyme
LFTHFVFGSNDPAKAARFYQAVLPGLGFTPRPGRQDGLNSGLAFIHGGGTHGGGLPQVVIARPADGRPFSRGNGYHVAFHAADEAAVRRFHAAALAAGGRDEGGPGLRPHYAPDYYGAYVRDPDGNKLQAVTYAAGSKAGAGGDVVSHITLSCDEPVAAGAFYEGLLGTLGLARLPAEETEGEDRAFGPAGCQLPIVFPQKTFDGRPAAPSRGSYPVLAAPDRQAVEAFHQAGLRLGGRSLAAPGGSADGVSADGGLGGFTAGIADPIGNAIYACYPAGVEAIRHR